MKQNTISRRGLLQGATLTLGAAALLQQTFQPSPVNAQSGDLPAGTIRLPAMVWTGLVLP